MFYGCSSLSSVPLFDTSKVTNVGDMLRECASLTSVPLFDTSNVSGMAFMLYECHSLTSIPLFNTNKVKRMTMMCYNCYNVQSGASALYRRASTQTNPPTGHNQTFYRCGINTTQGAAELAKIPSNWK